MKYLLILFTCFSFGQFNPIFFSNGGYVVTDSDAQAFIVAAGINNFTQKKAVNELVISLKANGLWTKLDAIYPFVGGTATSHKFNLKNPSDSNAAFRLVFNGTITHSSDGITPNGVNGYANTFYTPSANMTLDKGMLAIYSRTNIDLAGGFDMGSNGTANNYLNIVPRGSGNMVSDFNSNNADANRMIVSVPNSQGLFQSSRKSTTNGTLYKNGVILKNETNIVSTTLNTFSLYISARNNNGSPGVGSFSSRNLSFAAIGSQLWNDTDAANFYTIVQAFQTTLGRQV